MEGQPNEGKGKITIPWKWRDEEGEDTIDLSDPNDVEKLQRKWNQAHGYEKGQVELKDVKGRLEKVTSDIEYWNGLIAEGSSTGDKTKVFAALQMAGLKMDNVDIDDDKAIMDEGSKQINELKKELDNVKAAFFYKEDQATHSHLEAKYNDGKHPEYKRKEIEDFAAKENIPKLEDAYKLLHYDDLLKVQAKDDINKSKKHSDKIKKVASIEPGSGNLPAPPVEKHSDYGKATEGWASDPAITESLFDDE